MANKSTDTAKVDLVSLTLAKAAFLISEKQLSPVELTGAILERIEVLDHKIGAFITIAGDQAMEAARTAENEIAHGKYRGPLHGIPIGLKDTNYTQGIRTTAASKVLKDFAPEFDATIVQRFKEAGAIIIGKTNLPEFSFGGETPGTHNPWNLSKSPGGSSGGSGAALAASMLLGATGGDTTGSIRNPAANCGVVGMKPTFGLVSRYGVIPISWTLDHVGPLARTVEDCAILLKTMAGYDPNDAYSARQPVPDYPQLLKRDIRGMRLGVLPPAVLDTYHPESRRTYEDAVNVMERLGVQLREIELPATIKTATAAHLIIRICEAATYHRQFLLTRADEYGADDAEAPPMAHVRTTLEAGSLLTAAQYLKAQQVRKIFNHEMRQFFDTLEAVLSPAMPSPPSEPFNTPINFRLEFNLCGFPAITVPAGFSESPPGLPMGLQIAAKPFQDSVALALAYAYESATDWHNRRPGI